VGGVALVDFRAQSITGTPCVRVVDASNPSRNGGKKSQGGRMPAHQSHRHLKAQDARAPTHRHLKAQDARVPITDNRIYDAVRHPLASARWVVIVRPSKN